MDTNLKEKEPLTNIPAGIFHGTEVFYIGTKAFALHEGFEKMLCFLVFDKSSEKHLFDHTW